MCAAKCVCGSEKEYRLDSVVQGRIKSCGCRSFSTKQRSAESHIGETINNMTLLEIVGRDQRRRAAIGRFRCGYCGSEHKECSVYKWKGNSLKSCGCKKPNKPTKPEDHIGVRYNDLTLLKITGSNKRGYKTGLYQCHRCGKTKDNIKITEVTQGKTKTCGCALNKAEDNIGKVYGNLKLEMVTQSGNPAKGINQTKALFHCQQCDKVKELDCNPVVLGFQTDCGCSKHHGFYNHKAYNVYRHMIDRCTNPLSKQYSQWGARGVTIHPRWMEPNGQGLINFIEDVGNDRPSKKYSLHRMWKYNENNRLEEMMEYGPDTVKWATARQQTVEQRSPSLNKKVAKFEKMLDQGLTIEQMAEKLKLKPTKIAFFLSTMGLLEGYEYKD